MTNHDVASLKHAERNVWLDILKAFAILAVVFYHLGVLPYGYLGVDLFLVINGFLITQSIMKSYTQKRSFSYISFMLKRIVRLWPLVLFASAVSLAVGYFTMLPDDLENLGESVVAANCFMNNVLACITTKNYWDVVNNYKPLMHTWYLGVVMQCYVVFPLFFMVPYKFVKNKTAFAKVVYRVLFVITALSLLLYVLPTFSAAQKFYYVPFRFFEIGVGALTAFWAVNSKNIFLKKYAWLFAVVILAIFILPLSFISAAVKLLLVAAASSVCLLYSELPTTLHTPSAQIRGVLSKIGTMSYSIFIWHQVVFALYRYAVRAAFTALDYAVVLLLTALLSIVSYTWLEQGIFKPNNKKSTGAIWVLSAVLFVVTTGLGLQLYRIGGIVRDVPELGISKQERNRGVHAAYNDKIYKMNTDFENDGRIKVFVVGNSFGRDWVNVMLESSMKDNLDISYAFSLPDFETYTARVQSADYIFWVGIPTAEEEAYLHRNMKPEAELYGVGTKNYGECNGNIYNKRSRSDYFEQRAAIMTNILEDYQKEKTYWADHYVDFMAPIIDAENTVPVFSDEHTFISQDCRHLTQNGAKFYAGILDMESIFKKEE